MQYFEVILEHGHIGAGSSYEAKRYLMAKDIVSVIAKTKKLPRVKRKDTIEAVKSVRSITRSEYIQGKIEELKNPYLFKVWGGYRCPVCRKRFKDLFSLKKHMEIYTEGMLKENGEKLASNIA